MLLRRLSAITVLLLSLGTANMAMAAPQPISLPILAQNMGGGGNQREHHQELFQQLNLSPEQTQRMQAIRSQYKDQLSQKRDALKQARQELHNMMAGNGSASQLREKHNQVQALMQQMSDMQFESMLQMREILTPEQRSQLATLMEERMENFRNRNENGRSSR